MSFLVQLQALRSQQQTLRCALRQSIPRHSGQRFSSTTANADTLSWPEYLKIRRARRRWQAALTIPCALVGFAGGAAYFGSLDTDPTKPIMGIDAFFFYGICTMACGGGGALLGPTLGSAVWRSLNRRAVSLMDAKDRQFFQHIAKNRVDPNLQSPTTPVPDYYGEKIGSLHQYRSWLRDQNKYRRKATFSET